MDAPLGFPKFFPEATFELREKGESYDFDGKNSSLRFENTYLWDDLS